MKKINECPYEREVHRAVTHGAWTEELRAHVRGCAACRLEAEIGKTMRALAVDTAVPQLTSARVLWLKAQYVRRQERISILDLIAMIGMGAGGLVLLAGLLIWWIPGLFGSALAPVAPGTIHLMRNVPISVSAVVLPALIAFAWFMTRERFFSP